MKKIKKIGLSLYGGGYRAAAFHLGTLKKFHELGLLGKVDFLSTISGGSIIGAYYCLKGDNFQEFENEFKKCLQKSIVGRIIFSVRFILRIVIIVCVWFASILFLTIWPALCLILLTVILIAIYFFKLFPTTRLKVKAYKKIFFKGIKLSSLPSNPAIVINSTNLDTGTLLSFTREKVFDSSYKYKLGREIDFNTDKIEIAEAVAASTAVPYVFSPLYLKKEQFKNQNDFAEVKPTLVDGGLYDNQGIYRLTQKHSNFKSDIVIVSDGSYPFEKKFIGINPLPVLNRVQNVLMNRIKNMQFIQNIYNGEEDEVYEIAYLSLNWQYENCINGFVNAVYSKQIRKHLLELHDISEELQNDKTKLTAYIKNKISFEKILQNRISDDDILAISKISTSLRALTSDQIDLMVKHAGALTEIQLRLYCPSFIL